ncbi:MAG: hypothetical protein F6K00_12915 [Leptolyngbya sp. SIOISBB]|nr:hypothetical protein [Leptolyngbya sp. SIOISBB]
MTADNSSDKDELKNLLTAWADSIIQSAKQLMINGKAHLIAVSGMPWYCQEGDAWIDESWFINVALSRYERFKDLSDRWLTDELEILVRHFPSEYSKDARLRIEQWYEKSGFHDPEDWWALARTVYPQHSIFQELHECPENYSERALLASLGYEDMIAELRENLLTEWEHRAWYWVSEILSCVYSIGGARLINLVVSHDELQQIRQVFLTLADQEFPNDSSAPELELHNEILGQANCIRTAVRLDWQDVIDSLSKNQNYFAILSIYDILWWSLTDKKQLVQDFIVRISPHKSRLEKPSSSHIGSESMAFAISWKRATSI